MNEQRRRMKTPILNIRDKVRPAIPVQQQRAGMLAVETWQRLRFCSAVSGRFGRTLLRKDQHATACAPFRKRRGGGALQERKRRSIICSENGARSPYCEWKAAEVAQNEETDSHSTTPPLHHSIRSLLFKSPRSPAVHGAASQAFTSAMTSDSPRVTKR